MNSTSILIRTDPKVKAEAQKTAKELGLTLSTVVTGLLREFARTKTVTFSAREETPNEYFQKTLKEAREERKRGEASPVFDNADDAIKWLNK